MKNIWKSYIWTADKDVNESDPRSNVHYLGSSENKAWKKIQACTGFEPMTKWTHEPTVDRVDSCTLTVDSVDSYTHCRQCYLL